MNLMKVGKLNVGSAIKINGKRQPFFRLDYGKIDKTEKPVLHYHNL